MGEVWLDRVVSIPTTQGECRMLTDAEKATARRIYEIMHPWPCRDIDGLRAEMRASRAKHGDDRHDAIKWHASHASPEQASAWPIS